MADLRYYALARIAAKISVDLHTAGATKLYTTVVPYTHVTHIVIRKMTDSLVGCNDVNFGANAADYNDWRDAVDLVALTGGAEYYGVIGATVDGNPAQYKRYPVGTDFYANVVSGATADPCTASIEIYGFFAGS